MEQHNIQLANILDMSDHGEIGVEPKWGKGLEAVQKPNREQPNTWEQRTCIENLSCVESQEQGTRTNVKTEQRTTLCMGVKDICTKPVLGGNS